MVILIVYNMLMRMDILGALGMREHANMPHKLVILSVYNTFIRMDVLGTSGHAHMRQNMVILIVYNMLTRMDILGALGVRGHARLPHHMVN